jgi:hypothetical protein
MHTIPCACNRRCDQNEDQFTNASSLLHALARLHKGMANSSALTKARKDTFDRHLLSSIDLLVYAELTIIYLYEYVAPLAFKPRSSKSYHGRVLATA